jgi:hypothetical protein
MDMPGGGGMPPEGGGAPAADPKAELVAMFEQLVASGMSPDEAMQVIMQLQGQGPGGTGPGTAPPPGGMPPGL